MTRIICSITTRLAESREWSTYWGFVGGTDSDWLRELRFPSKLIAIVCSQPQRELIPEIGLDRLEGLLKDWQGPLSHGNDKWWVKIKNTEEFQDHPDGFAGAFTAWCEPSIEQSLKIAEDALKKQ